MKTIHFFIYSSKIGGAEKRFIGLFLEIIKRRDFYFTLTISKSLYLECLSIEELSGIELHKKNVFISSLHIEGIYSKQLAKSDILHFIMNAPTKRIKQNTIFSLTESHISNINFKGKIKIFVSCFLSENIDVLDPKIYSILKKLFFYKKKRIHQTSNSFVDFDKYQPNQKKQNWVVFLGIFSTIKQVDRFINSIPEIDQICKNENLKFFILGYGQNEEKIFHTLESYRKNGIDITYGFEPNPHEILKNAKVIYSLQKNTNYPSKSLLEGISCGCLPVVTDVGESRRIARPEFSYFIQENFKPSEIAEATKKIIGLTDKQFMAKVQVARDSIENKFSIEKMTDYYISLYKSIA